MEPGEPSDVDVLDDLLHDVDGEGDDFEDAAAFFDADPDEDGERGVELSPDNVLSQLDAVTSLDGVDEQGENTEEFHDSAASPVSEPDEDRAIKEISPNETISPESAESEQVSPLSVVQAVLDLATTEDEELQSQTLENEPNSDQEQASPIAHDENDVPSDEGKTDTEDVETKTDTEEAAVDEEALDGVAPDVDQSSQSEGSDDPGDNPPPPPKHDTMDQSPSDSAVMPPPAPVPVIVGSMNPKEDENDDSDDSQDEEEGEGGENAPPLQLNITDDDEDVLEVDPAVVTSLQKEQKEKIEPENALLNALPTAKTDASDAIDLSLGEEIRAANVTTLEPNSPFKDIHKMAGGSNADATFGISYQSMRKKVDEPSTDEKGGDYSLPSGPAFPDEREYENEMELTSDVSFSVATSGMSPTKAAEDDEFSFEVGSPAGSSILSEEVLKARRESMETQKREEEEKLLKELKQATDEEKKNIESSNTIEAQPATETQVDTDALSLTELHGIYKRGLGDQEVLMDESAENKPEASEIGRSKSVMGRIFSQTTDTIAEESDDCENEEEVAPEENVNTEDKKTTEKSDVDESAEWREIKLVQHRTSESGSTSPQAASVSRVSYAEAAQYYAETPDVMQHRDIIVSEDFPPTSCIRCLSRPRLTFAGAIDERDRVFCIAATAFDAHNEIVVGMLQTIYRKVTKSARDAPLIGSHWEDIGFQGSDPSTDLRGCGVFSLLQILYLVDTFPDLSNRFHALSQHPTRHFPFACVLINVTLQCVVALRSGALYQECNKQASVLTGMNRMYVALTSQLHDAIQARSDEIPLVMKDILDRGRVSPSKAIDQVFDGNSLRPSRPAPVGALSKSKSEVDNMVEFTEIGLHAVDEDQ